MNLCFFSGKIINDINFKFIINSKKISIAYFNLQLNNKSIIKIIGYNEMADYCYSKLRKDDFIHMEGCLNNKLDVIITSIQISYEIKYKNNPINSL